MHANNMQEKIKKKKNIKSLENFLILKISYGERKNLNP